MTEAAWLLRRQYRPLDRIADAHAAGLFRILSLDGDDLAAIAELMRRYEDIRLQLADAALIHLAEREGVYTVFTTDRRNSFDRPSQAKSFTRPDTGSRLILTIARAEGVELEAQASGRALPMLSWLKRCSTTGAMPVRTRRGAE